MCLAHDSKRLALVLFCDFLVQKAHDFSPSLGGNSPYKYRIPHSQFLF